MTTYAHVEKGEVKKIGGLPKNFGNVSGFNKFDDAKLKTHGFLPVVYNRPEYNPLTEKLVGPTYDIKTNRVEVNYTVQPLGSTKIEANKENLCNMLCLEINKALFNTDWIYLEDSGLIADDLDTYKALRANLLSIKADPMEIDLSDLKDLHEKLAQARQMLEFRYNDLSNVPTDKQTTFSALQTKLSEIIK